MRSRRQRRGHPLPCSHHHQRLHRRLPRHEIHFCQDKDGNITEVYSISAGLDYPGVSPEHAYLHDIGRARYIAITDEEAVQAFEYLARKEGIICAIESAHAVAGVLKEAKTMNKDDIVVITLSGRGDKDVAAIARYRGENLHD